MLLMVAIGVLSFSHAGEGRPATLGNVSSIIAEQYSYSNNSQSSPPVFCGPMTWYDLCWFFFTNYIMHALSVRSLPGENAYSSTLFRFLCLLIPYTGVRRGLSLVLRASNLCPNDLQAAAKAMALCMVVRSKDWRPRSGDVLDGCSVKVGETDAAGKENAGQKNESECCHCLSNKKEVSVMATVESGACPTHASRRESLNAVIRVESPYNPELDPTFASNLAKHTVRIFRTKSTAQDDLIIDHNRIIVQGLCRLPPGYELSYIPEDMKVYQRLTLNNATSPCPAPAGSAPSQQTKLVSSYAIPRILFSLVQTISGVYQLYKARGAQISQFGFAAYGLTVIPYVVVSVVNVLGSLLSSEYSAVCIVHSEIMDEMIGRGGMVDGVIGTTVMPKGNLEVDRIKGESHWKAEGKSFLFEGSQDTLRCRTLEDSSREEFAILNPKPSKPIPKPRFKARLRQVTQQLCLWQKPSKTPPTAASPITISIPSHLSYTRLPRPPVQGLLNIVAIILLCIAIFIPYLVIGLLSGFRANNATSVQMNYAILWLAGGQVHGYFAANIEKLTGKNRAFSVLLTIFVAYGSYCLGGFIIVAEELLQSGMCTP